MEPPPVSVPDGYLGSGKLAGKAALITGGDSGIDRAVAVLFAMEGADVAIFYLGEHEDAAETVRLVEAQGRQCLSLACDIRSRCSTWSRRRGDSRERGRARTGVDSADPSHLPRRRGGGPRRPDADGTHRPAGGDRAEYLFLASDDSSYMSGQVLHPNGGSIVGG